MKVTILKEWQTEEEVEVPDGLEGKELRKWLEDAAPDLANCFDEADWQATFVMDEEGDDLYDEPIA